MRDEGENHAEFLEKAGVNVQCTRYEGMVHEFFGLAGGVTKTKDALNEVSDWIFSVYKKAPELANYH